MFEMSHILMPVSRESIFFKVAHSYRRTMCGASHSPQWQTRQVHRQPKKIPCASPMS